MLITLYTHVEIEIHVGFKVTNLSSSEGIPSLADWLIRSKYFDLSVIFIVIVYDWTFFTHHMVYSNKKLQLGSCDPYFTK